MTYNVSQNSHQDKKIGMADLVVLPLRNSYKISSE